MYLVLDLLNFFALFPVRWALCTALCHHPPALDGVDLVGVAIHSLDDYCGPLLLCLMSFILFKYMFCLVLLMFVVLTWAALVSLGWCNSDSEY